MAVFNATDKVTVDGAYGAGSTYTWTSAAIGTAASDRQVIVIIGEEDVSTIDSITVGGTSLTKRVASSGQQRVEIWSGNITTGTTANIVVTHSLNYGKIAIVVGYLNSSTAAPSASGSEARTFPAAYDVTPTIASNQAAVSGFFWDQGSDLTSLSVSGGTIGDKITGNGFSIAAIWSDTVGSPQTITGSGVSTYEGFSAAYAVWDSVTGAGGGGGGGGGPTPPSDQTGYSRILGPIPNNIKDSRLINSDWSTWYDNFISFGDTQYSAYQIELAGITYSRPSFINYYDRAKLYYAWYYGSGDTSYRDRARVIAGDYLTYITTTTPSAHWSQMEGIGLYYLDTGLGATQIAQVADNFCLPYYFNDLDNVSASSATDQRQQGRFLQALMVAKHCGLSSISTYGTNNGDYSTKLSDGLTKILNSQDGDGRWFVPSISAVKPFMVGVLMDQLINYYNFIDQDDRIPTAIQSFLDWLWANMYHAGTKSFYYIEFDSIAGEDPKVPAPDLNGLLIGAFGWMYYITGDATYKTRGDLLLQGTNSGAYLIPYKQFNESYSYSYRYLVWAGLMDEISFVPTDGISAINVQYNFNVPQATLVSTQTEYTPRFNVSVGTYAKENDVVEAQYQYSNVDGWSTNLGTAIATLDLAGIQTGFLDWDGMPSLPDGVYKFRFRSRRDVVNTGWSDDVTVTISGAGYGVDATKPILSNPSVNSTNDTTATVTIDTNEDNGTLFGVAARNSNALTEAQVINGIVEDAIGNDVAAPTGASKSQTISSTGTKTFTFTGLTPGADYYFSFCQVDLAGNKSLVVMSQKGTTTDTAIPLLSGVTMSALTSTTASGQFTTSQPLGNYQWVVVTGTAPSVSQVKAGQNGSGGAVGTGMKGGPTAVTTSGTYAISATGLTANTAGYKLYVVHTDELAQDSAVGASAAFTTPVAVDVTAPVLTGAAYSSVTDTTASASVSTDEGNGNYYWVAQSAALAAPSAVQVEAGQTQAGVDAGTGKKGGPTAVTSAGIKTASASSLTQNTAYKIYFMHKDAAGNRSAVVGTTSFTTAVTPAGGPLGSALELTLISTTDDTKPNFTLVFPYPPQVGDVVRLSWSGYATGFVDKTITSNHLTLRDPLFAQDIWVANPFALENYTFQAKQTRGASNILSNSINITFGGSSGGSSTPPPPPVANTYYYRTESGDILAMEDGSRYLLETAP